MRGEDRWVHSWVPLKDISVDGKSIRVERERKDRSNSYDWYKENGWAYKVYYKGKSHQFIAKDKAELEKILRSITKGIDTHQSTMEEQYGIQNYSTSTSTYGSTKTIHFRDKELIYSADIDQSQLRVRMQKESASGSEFYPEFRTGWYMDLPDSTKAGGNKYGRMSPEVAATYIPEIKRHGRNMYNRYKREGALNPVKKPKLIRKTSTYKGFKLISEYYQTPDGTTFRGHQTLYTPDGYPIDGGTLYEHHPGSLKDRIDIEYYKHKIDEYVREEQRVRGW